MLDTSNYSKTAIKRIKSFEGNGFVWQQHGLSSRHPPGSHRKHSLMAKHPVLWAPILLPGDEEWGMAGQWFTPSIPNSQGGDESPPSPPSEHPGAEGCGLHSCCEQKSNPSSEIQGAGSAQQPNLFCVIRDTDTAASQWEADPAPDELGEYRLLITGGWDALRMQQNAYFFIQQPITSHNVMLHYLQFLQGFAEVPIGLEKELNQFIKKWTITK